MALSSYIDSTGYSGRIYEPEGIREHAEFVNAELRELAGQFDFVAVTGKSGMAVAFAALALGGRFNLVTIRKGESSHGVEFEGTTGNGDGMRYVVVDDLIDSGATLDRIHERLQVRLDKPVAVAALLYADYDHGGTHKVKGQRAPIRVIASRS